MYTNQQKKPREIDVIVKKVEKDKAFLHINPFDYNVKEIIKRNPGHDQYFKWDQTWGFRLKYLPDLQFQLSALSDMNIYVSMKGLDLVNDYLVRTEEDRKLNFPTFEDYQNNPQFYNSICSTVKTYNETAEQEEPKKQEKKTEKTTKNKKQNKNNKTSKVQNLHPVFSEKTCAYKYFCDKAKDNCMCHDFLSLKDAFDIKDKPVEYEPALKDPQPGAVLSGKCNKAFLTGYLADESGVFIVQKGSKMSYECASSLDKKSVKKREELQTNKILDDDNVFKYDYPFANIRFAASVVTGSTADWHTYLFEEGSKRALCKGTYIEKFAPSIAEAKINNIYVYGIPVPGECKNGIAKDINFVVPEGSIIPDINRSKLNNNLSSKYSEIKKKINKTGILKEDIVFESADEAAKILTGNMKADASIWNIADGITMKDIQNLHKLEKYEGAEVFHIDRKTTGTVAALVKKDQINFVMLKGSIIAPGLNKGTPIGSGDLYMSARADGKIKNGVVIEDISFDSPTSAANFCSGRSINGRKDWKTRNGKCLESENRSKKRERIQA